MGTPTKKGERSIFSPAVRGMSAKRATYVLRKDATHVETLMTPAAKETNAVKEAHAGLMECVSAVGGTTSDVVKTIAARRVLPAAPIRNATSAESMICLVAKGVCAKNGLSVAQMATAIPAEVMMGLAVKKSYAERVMSVDQMACASHVGAMKNRAV